jgi:glycosyltransferase involved in cell wall biosynthesis
MRVLVYPHDLSLGGSQLNAIEIAAAVQSAGHPTVIAGRPGPLVQRVQELGLEFIEMPPPGRRPSPRAVKHLIRVVDDMKIDIVHGYEWPPTLDAVLVARQRPRLSVVSTVMSMAVAPFIPKTVPLVVGTEQIRAAEMGFGRANVDTLEPPVDIDFNTTGLDLGQSAFRARWGIDDSRFTVVVVSRLAHELKLEGLLSAMDGVAGVNERVPVRLVVVGDGPARDEVSEHARAVNARHGDGTVIVVGALEDPRVAYDVADVSIGMGGSALRALAFRKPLIVQGEGGFWKLLTPESLQDFLWTGWYGIGSDPGSGVHTFSEILLRLLAEPSLREQLGRFGRETVEQRFSLEAAGRKQVQIYGNAMNTRFAPATIRLQDALAGARYAGYYAAKRVRRAVGRERTDDFNARPVSLAQQGRVTT